MQTSVEIIERKVKFLATQVDTKTKEAEILLNQMIDSTHQEEKQLIEKRINIKLEEALASQTYAGILNKIQIITGQKTPNYIRSASSGKTDFIAQEPSIKAFIEKSIQQNQNVNPRFILQVLNHIQSLEYRAQLNKHVSDTQRRSNIAFYSSLVILASIIPLVAYDVITGNKRSEIEAFLIALGQSIMYVSLLFSSFMLIEDMKTNTNYIAELQAINLDSDTEIVTHTFKFNVSNNPTLQNLLPSENEYKISTTIEKPITKSLHRLYGTFKAIDDIKEAEVNISEDTKFHAKIN